MSRLMCVLAGLVVVALVGTLAAVAVQEEGDDTVAVKDLPANVVAVVGAVCPGGKIVSAEKEVERKGGKVTIEYEVKVAQPDGKIVEVEVELDKAGKVRKVQVGDDDDDGEDYD